MLVTVKGPPVLLVLALLLLPVVQADKVPGYYSTSLKIFTMNRQDKMDGIPSCTSYLAFNSCPTPIHFNFKEPS